MKITQYPYGGNLQGGDRLIMSRQGRTYQVSGADIMAGAVTDDEFADYKTLYDAKIGSLEAQNANLTALVATLLPDNITLQPLTLASTDFEKDVAFSVNIVGKTSGSNITATSSEGSILTVSGSVLSGTFSGLGAQSVTLFESYPTALNNPNYSTIPVSVTVPVVPTLGALSLSGPLQIGIPANVTITGWSSGSAIASSIPGMSQPVFASGAWTMSGTPTGSPATIANGLVETLAGAIGNPHSTSVTVAAAPVTLGTLTLSNPLNTGVSSSGNILGATAGSTITRKASLTGLTINSGARTYTWDGSNSAGTTSDGLTETLAGATNTPNVSPVTISSVSVPDAPTVAVTPGNNQLSIGFADGATGGSPITGHEYHRSTTSGFTPTGTTPGTGTCIATPSTSPYIDSTAVNGQLYFVKMITRNAIGPSSPSVETSGTPSGSLYNPTADAEVGEWWDFNDNSSAFSDVGGTSVAVAGSTPVQRINGQKGVANLTDSTSPPTYVNDTLTGRKAAKFNRSTAQRLGTTAATIINAATGNDKGFTIVEVYRRNTGGVSQTTSAFWSSVVASGQQILLRHAIGSSNALSTVRYVQSAGVSVSGAESTGSMTANQWYVVTRIFTGTVLTIRVNGTQTFTGTVDSASMALTNFTIGALFNNSTGSFETTTAFDGEIDSVYILPNTTTLSTAVTNVEAFGASRITPVLPNLKNAIAAMQAGSGRARIGVIGDSLTAGWGSGVASGTGSGTQAGDSPNVKRAKSLPHKLAELFTVGGINSRSDAVWGDAITGSNNADINSYNPNLTLGADWAADSALSVGGKILRASTTGTTSLAFTPEFEANRFDIYYTTSPGNGTFTVTDSSGTLATINTDAASGFGMMTVSRASSSTTPISIQRNGTGGFVYIAGIVPHSTTARRLEIWNMGAAGWKVSDWLTTTNPWSPGNAIATIQADCYTIELGANDMNAGVSSSTFSSQLQSLITKCKTLANTDVQLIKTHVCTNGSYNLSGAHLAAMDTLSTTNLMLPPIDFNGGVSLVTADRYDGVHLSESGYSKEATFEYNYVRAKV